MESNKDKFQELEYLYSSYFGIEISESYLKSIMGFLERIDFDEVYNYLDYSCLKMNHANVSLKYFCKCCLNRIKILDSEQ